MKKLIRNAFWFTMALLFVVIVLGMATGCTKVVKEYVEIPVEVKVPVAIKCKLTMPEAPTINIGRMEVPTELDAMGILLMRENEENRRYAKELKAILGKCAE